MVSPQSRPRLKKSLWGALTNEGGGGAQGAPGVGKVAQRPSMLTRAPTAEEATEEAEND